MNAIELLPLIALADLIHWESGDQFDCRLSGRVVSEPLHRNAHFLHDLINKEEHDRRAAEEV